MATQQTRTLPAEARALRRRIETWRRERRSGAPMPEGLWARATALARRHGTYTIARGLPVDYGSLKRRVEAIAAVDAGTVGEAIDGGDSSGDLVPAGFIEIPPVALPEATGTVIELARPDGARMVVRLSGEASLDLAALALAFCGGGA